MGTGLSNDTRKCFTAIQKCAEKCTGKKVLFRDGNDSGWGYWLGIGGASIDDNITEKITKELQKSTIQNVRGINVCPLVKAVAIAAKLAELSKNPLSVFKRKIKTIHFSKDKLPPDVNSSGHAINGDIEVAVKLPDLYIAVGSTILDGIFFPNVAARIATDIINYLKKNFGFGNANHKNNENKNA